MKTRLRIPIATILVYVFAIVVASAVAATLVFALSGATKSTSRLLTDKAAGNISRVQQAIDAKLTPVLNQAEWVQQAVELGRLDIANMELLTNVIISSMAATPHVRGAAVFTKDYRRFRFGRDFKGPLTDTLTTDPWMKKIVDQGRLLQAPTWGEIIWIDSFKEPAINLRTPLYHDGEYLGLFGQIVSISDLSRVVSQEASLTQMTPFILFGEEYVIAHPLLTVSVGGDRTEFLTRVEELGDPVLAAYNSGDAIELDLVNSNDQMTVFGREVDDELHVYITAQEERYGSPWTIGLHLPASSEDEAIGPLLKAGAAGLVMMVLAVVVSIIVGRRVSRPIQGFAKAARSIGRGDFTTQGRVAPSRIAEFDDAATAFNSMVEGLQERQKIRELFGKFVPESVAGMLLRDGGVLQPQYGEATILFADLEGFTALSERLGPTETVTMLNEYFSVIAEVLEQNDGVITQFQGDAVLATFNLPIAHRDHAARAVKSAVEIHAAIAERVFAGQKLRCRIGVNTGDVVAGNVGAAGRMSYTVHGDAVNVAARLESMNKELGTRVLLSQSTLSGLGGRPVGLREVGVLPVRGKLESVSLFTLDIPETDTPETSTLSSPDPLTARATPSAAEKAETS